MPARTPAAIRHIGPLLLVLLLGCANQDVPLTLPTATTTDAPAPPSAAAPTAEGDSFDLALVKSLFESDCAASRFDETFCERVVIDRWKASGTTLVVPTGLPGSDVRTARSICRVIQEALSEDPDRSRLGIRLITVLNRYNVEADTCWDRF